MRIRVEDAVVEFDDAVQGRVRQSLATDVGDFVLLRADGLAAYQLAVVVDDAAQAITDIVRGADLLDSTPRQIFLQRRLAFATPRYAHVPVATDAGGEKLSKQTLAPPVTGAPQELARALAFLGQPLPPDATRMPCPALLAWAVAHWDRTAIPHRRAIPV
jgi:glutamyl-Q tRNA(Asp) synthetase